MGDTTEIRTADHTWNPWIGCDPTSEGCRHCYAAEMHRLPPRSRSRFRKTDVRLVCAGVQEGGVSRPPAWDPLPEGDPAWRGEAGAVKS
jgi:protein gp37